ncbi:MAG: hypothetical protein FD123_3651 [Bacteroidetes bacterium]|nr:MAG: hypothetical protein FD123_3651 [Bacteroidota bacterium]
MKKLILGASIVVLTAMTAFAGGDKGTKTKGKAKAKTCCATPCDPKSCVVDGKKCDPKDCPKNCDYSKCAKEVKKAK